MENEKDIAIQINGLKKRYRLGVIGGDTLQEDIQSWWARIRGKDDPNLMIGKKARNKNESFMALDGIDLTVYKGERLGIIGHNGAGKSALLKLLSRVTAPTEGEIKIDGRISSMLEVGTGFNRELTGRENIYLNGAILGMTTAEVDSKIEQIIEFSECRQFIDTPVKRYSSGMYVKLAFAVAAHLDSEILIMDEVLAVGDIAFQNKCLDKMSQVSSAEGRTVLYVSHNMNTIRQLCERCIVMDHGKIIFNGDVEEAIEKYTGTMNWNELPVKYDFSNISRKYHYGKHIKLINFEFLHKENASYSLDDRIIFRATLHSRIDMNDLQIVLCVSDSHGTNRIATSFSERFSVKKNSDAEMSLVFDVASTGLIENKYFLSLLLIKSDTVGNFFCYDKPDVEIPVQLFNKDENHIRWKRKDWGSLKFPEMKVLETDA